MRHSIALSQFFDKLKILALQAICFGAAFFSPTQISIGCGPIIDDFTGYSFLNPEILARQADEAPFMLDFGTFERFYIDQEAIKAQNNTNEWYQRFCEIASLEDINYLVYKSPWDEVSALSTAIDNPDYGLPINLRQNSFARHLLRHECRETVNYLLFAKRCEPYVIRQDAWEEATRDVEAMENLIEVGLRDFRVTESHYIRLRYAYQIVRLAHYVKDYYRTVELYDELLPKIDADSSLIYFWMLGHKAGALRSLGRLERDDSRFAEAAYNFGVVFKNCPSRRESAFRSFHIPNDAVWQQALLLCVDDEERAALYTMRANAKNAKVVEEMESIYQLAPKSEFLEILLIKEIRELERNILGVDTQSNKRRTRQYQRLPDQELGERLITLQNFVRKMRQENRVLHPELWHIAEGYLEFLAGDYYAAKKTLETVAENTLDEALQDQLEAFNFAVQIASYQEVTDSVEAQVARLIRNTEVYNQYPDFEEYLKDKFAQLYREADHPGKAFRMQYPLSALKPNPQLPVLNDLLAVARKENPNMLEKQLITDPDGNNQLFALLDILATHHMAEGQFQVALDVYKNMPRAEWDRFGTFKPFIPRISECVNCRVSSDTANFYNKGEILEAIINSDLDAKTGAENAADLFYTIGVGLYNMSYFGYAWNATDYFRSGASYSPWNLDDEDFVFQHYYYPFNNRENMDVSLARTYLEQARNLADSQGNYELAARAAFMAAKCEQKQYYTSGLYESPCNNCIPELPEQYLTNFKILRNRYDTVSYVGRIIQECKYFQVYMSK